MLPERHPSSRASAKTAGRWRAFFTGLLLSVVAACAIGYFASGPSVARDSGTPASGMTPVKNAPPKVPANRELAILSGGCFWSEQALFQQLKGVDKVVPGYAGGWVVNPSYEQVCTETTGHAETVAITYDPKIISYHDLLTIYLTTMDPTTLNRQGADEGTSYRSAIWYLNDTQRKMAKKVIGEITAAKVWRDPIVTTVSPYTSFYTAEAYHFDYYNQHPNEGYCQAVIAPKLAHFRDLYRSRLK